MNSPWARLALSDLPISQWKASSYLYKLVGIIAPFREGAWLLQWGEILGALLISLVISLAPFVSTTLIGILLFTCALFWLLLTISDNTQSTAGGVHLILFIYWCIATVAVGFSPAKSAAFEGWIKLTLYLLMFALAARVLRYPRLLSWVIGLFLHIALIVSIYGVRQQLAGVQQLATWNDPNSVLADDSRVYSYLGNPNLLAAYLLPAIALSIAAVFVWRSGFAKSLALTMVIVNSACLYFTDSRGGWIGMLALITTFFFLLRYWWHDYLPRWGRVWLIPVVAGSVLGVLLVALVLVEPLRLRFLSIFAGRGDSSNNFRINVWEAVIRMIKDRPIIGIGPGNEVFNKIYPRYMNSGYTALSAYSIFLEITVETGLIGFSCFLWFLLTTFHQGLSQLSRWRTSGHIQGFWIMGAIAAMAGLIAHGMVDTVWYRPQINTLWWLMVAIIVSQYRLMPKQNQ